VKGLEPPVVGIAPFVAASNLVHKILLERQHMGELLKEKRKIWVRLHLKSRSIKSPQNHPGATVAAGRGGTGNSRGESLFSTESQR
jgi:hypothetical protein